MFGKFSASFLAVLTISSFAYAQEATSQGNSTNFILIDYGISLSADGDEKESMTLGTGGDAVNETELLLSDGTIDDSSAIGIGLGHRYGNNIAAVLRYETGELESGTPSIQIAPGSTITAAGIAGDVTTDLTTFMLEGVYFVPYSERIEFWGMLGIGQTEIETSNVQASITDNGQALNILALCSASDDNTSTRFGAGATYYMSQTQGFYAGVAMTNYGDAGFMKSSDNGTCENTRDSLTINDIETTDLRIGYFRSF